VNIFRKLELMKFEKWAVRLPSKHMFRLARSSPVLTCPHVRQPRSDRHFGTCALSFHLKYLALLILRPRFPRLRSAVHCSSKKALFRKIPRRFTVVTQRLLLVVTPSIVMLPVITTVYGHCYSFSSYHWLYIILGFNLFITAILAKILAGIGYTSRSR
jgi:hypothetical protein